MLPRINRSKVSTTNNTTHSATNYSIPLLSWFHRPTVPSADNQTPSTSSNYNKSSSLLPRKH